MGQGSSKTTNSSASGQIPSNTSVTTVSKNNSKNGKDVVTIPSPNSVSGGKRKNKNRMNGGVASIHFQRGTQPSEEIMQRATTADMVGGKYRTIKHRSHKHKTRKGKKSRHHSKKHE